MDRPDLGISALPPGSCDGGSRGAPGGQPRFGCVSPTRSFSRGSSLQSVPEGAACVHLSPRLPSHGQHAREFADARTDRTCNMAACDTQGLCDDDSRDWGDEIRPDEREEIVELPNRSTRASPAPDYARSFSLSVPEGQAGIIPSGWPPEPVLVKRIVPGSRAAAAKVELGDELLALNGVPIAQMDRSFFDMAMRQRPLIIWMHHGR